MEGNHETYQTLGTIEDAVEVVKEQNNFLTNYIYIYISAQLGRLPGIGSKL